MKAHLSFRKCISLINVRLHEAFLVLALLIVRFGSLNHLHLANFLISSYKSSSSISGRHFEMLKTDLFDENGAFVGASAVEIVQPGIAPIGPYSPFSAHFTIPNDVLQRLVKNKQELAMLQRLGALSSVVEQHLDRLASPKATAVSQRKVRPSIEVSGPSRSCYSQHHFLEKPCFVGIPLSLPFSDLCSFYRALLQAYSATIALFHLSQCRLGLETHPISLWRSHISLTLPPATYSSTHLTLSPKMAVTDAKYPIRRSWKLLPPWEALFRTCKS